jgi:acyl-CoA thioesterase FadM
MVYRLETARGVVAHALTEHALVGDDGRPRRIPREERDALRKLCGASADESPQHTA